MLNNILRVIILVIGLTAITFDGLLYNFFEKQKDELDSIRDKQDVEAEFNTNKFKYQQEQIDRLSQDLESTRQQMRDQKDTLLQEIEKRKQIENDSKDVRTSLVDVQAEADATKQYIKGWQKDYVSVLAQIEKEVAAIPDLKASIDSLKADIEKMTPPSVNNAAMAPAADNTATVPAADNAAAVPAADKTTDNPGDQK